MVTWPLLRLLIMTYWFSRVGSDKHLALHLLAVFFSSVEDHMKNVMNCYSGNLLSH